MMKTMMGYLVMALAVLGGRAGAGTGPDVQPPPEPRWGNDRLVEYRPGTLPIILSIPHEGEIIPPGVPSRRENVRGPDTHAMAYGMAVYRLIHERTGEWPHLVVCHLHRSRVDMNRGFGEATQGIGISENAWREYHGFLETAREDVEHRYGYGHLFDLHTMLRADGVEIGQRLGVQQLRMNDEDLSAEDNRERSSIRALAVRSDRTLAELVRGPESFGAMMERRGVECIPSPRQPGPPTDDFFMGGYIVRRHGSAQGGTVDATQIEGIRSHLDDPEWMKSFSHAVAESILEFMRTHYDFP